MSRIYMVRHGQAAAGFDRHLDPGLDDLGRSQAAATAEALAPLGPMPLYSSPFVRARETAEPLARRWNSEVVIEPRVAEIPSPTNVLAERAVWLRRAMQGRWRDLDEPLQSWRRELVKYLHGVDRDSVVVCHFIAINVAIGEARNDDRLVVFSPDNGSVTVLSNDAGHIRVVELGRSAQTHVN